MVVVGSGVQAAGSGRLRGAVLLVAFQQLPGKVVDVGGGILPAHAVVGAQLHRAVVAVVEGGGGEPLLRFQVAHINESTINLHERVKRLRLSHVRSIRNWRSLLHNL